MSSDKERKRVATQLGSDCILQGGFIPHNRTHTGKGKVLGQFSLGTSRSRRSSERAGRQVCTPGSRDI